MLVKRVDKLDPDDLDDFKEKTENESDKGNDFLKAVSPLAKEQIFQAYKGLITLDALCNAFKEQSVDLNASSMWHGEKKL